ncbi:MAG: DUF1538 domain-containing protein [Alphaproteobacteria bacterium]|nr:DUF1538 domain-containing protein [Alphaproteobacteria bacterium]
MRFLHSVVQTGRDLAPVVLVLAFFQIVIVQEPVTDLVGKLTGALLVLLGLALFLTGLSMSLFPLGERLAEEFARKANLWLLLAFAFAIGFGSTVAEPALIAVAEQAAAAMVTNGNSGDVAMTALVLRVATSAAVGLAVVLSCVRIIRGWPALAPVLAVYGLALVVTVLHPSSMEGIAFDAGAAATSAINIPLIAALGIGLATVLEGRSPLADGFGAVALASAMPMITILIGSAILR